MPRVTSKRHDGLSYKHKDKSIRKSDVIPQLIDYETSDERQEDVWKAVDGVEQRVLALSYVELLLNEGLQISW